MSFVPILRTADRHLPWATSASLAALLLAAAVHLHLVCGLICLHGEAAMAGTDVCHGAADGL